MPLTSMAGGCWATCFPSRMVRQSYWMTILIVVDFLHKLLFCNATWPFLELSLMQKPIESPKNYRDAVCGKRVSPLRKTLCDAKTLALTKAGYPRHANCLISS